MRSVEFLLVFVVAAGLTGCAADGEPPQGDSLALYRCDEVDAVRACGCNRLEPHTTPPGVRADGSLCVPGSCDPSCPPVGMQWCSASGFWLGCNCTANPCPEGTVRVDLVRCVPAPSCGANP